MTDQLTQQQREALEALEILVPDGHPASGCYAEGQNARALVRTYILNSTPTPSVPVSRLREIADAHFRKSVDITVSGDAAARHALISAILYSLAEEAEGDDPTPEAWPEDHGRYIGVPVADDPDRQE